MSLDLGPIHSLPVEIVVLRSVHRHGHTVAAPNLSFGSGSLVIVVLTGSPDPRQHPLGSGHQPVSGQLSERPAERPTIMSGFLSPFGVPAFASRIIRCPPRELGLPCGRLTGHNSRPDPDGITTFHTCEMRPGWVPPVSRGRRCSPDRQEVPGRRLPLSSGQPLHPTYSIPSGEVHDNETSTEVHAIHPSGLPLARNPRMEQRSFGFPSSFAPRRYQRRTSRAGPGHRTRA